MKLIWTKSNNPLSLLIRWGLREPCSHFAFVFDESVVFHSNLLGTHINWFNSFKKKGEIVYEIDIPLPLEYEEKVYQGVINTYIDHPYDFKAFAYFIWRAFLKRYFGKPIPAKNKWQDDSAYLCTGLAKAIPKEMFPQVSQISDADMTSPYELYLLLKQ